MPFEPFIQFVCVCMRIFTSVRPSIQISLDDNFDIYAWISRLVGTIILSNKSKCHLKLSFTKVKGQGHAGLKSCPWTNFLVIVFCCRYIFLFFTDSEAIHSTPKFVKDTSKYWYKPHISREEGRIFALINIIPFGASGKIRGF